MNTITKNCFILILTTLLASSLISRAQLVNENATTEAIQLKSFLDSIYGKKIISGQMDDSYLSYIQNTTGGKSPAMMGYDFNGICPSQGGNSDALKAIKWAKEQNGIVQFNWHWISPDANGDWSTSNFKLADALADTSSSSFKNLIRDMDLVAHELLLMQDSGIAVLWRPLHEAEGAWFWWGMAGGEACKSLYRLMYDRYVNHFGINNLIWVWNSYGTTKPNWYPGDDVVDIIAWDYPDYSATGSWNQYEQLFGESNKLFGIGEDGKLTDPDILTEQPWLYFLTWAYMVKDPSQKDGKNPKDWLFQVYNDSRVLTLDDLQPGPKAYAGPSQLIFDTDNSGTETITLDGSASYTNDGSINSYVWTENDVEIASGANPTIELQLGVHVIKLTITTSLDETKSAFVVITIKKPSLTLNKQCTASSTEGGFGNIATNAVDGDLSTRWSSAYADPQWFEVDLEKPYDIEKVIIHWEDASAKKYRIEQSNNQTDWIPVITLSNMAAGARTDSIKNLDGGARYIRMYGLERNTTYGYSFFEFEVFGNENPNAEPVEEVGNSISNNTKAMFEITPSLIQKGGKFNLLTNSKNLGEQVCLYSTTGELIMKWNIKNENQTIQLTSQINSGLYLVIMGNGAKSKPIKLIVK